MQTVTTIGLDIAKSVFQVMALTLAASRLCASNWSAATSSRSSKSCHHDLVAQSGALLLS